MKILLAEDDPISRLIMQRTLQNFGYQVIVAENGRKAADILSERDGPRLALVDWMMPELDGLALCREVRERSTEGAYVYILLLTSKQNSEDIVAGLEAGADDYITKPCHPAELRARLHTGRRILSLEEKLVQAREEMRIKATRDGLTSLWNRGSILSLMSTELERATRKRQPISVLLCDVDHFKSVNDTHGHLVGDLVLKEVAARLTAAVRAYDAVGRYGGEEFLILLNECDPGGLELRAEQIRQGVASRLIEVDGRELAISISIGAVTCEPADTGFPVERILARADDAMYRAKRKGRNCVVLAQHSLI
jgi:diguanylate cyclase (GGDEF)-like protein